jgi:predicted PurR-regulated permease PerM
MNKKSNLTETARLLRIVTFVVVVASLYFGRSVFIPLALALLLSLLLAPVMTSVAKLGLPRLASILLIALGLSVLAFGFAWKLTVELTDLAGQLPGYKTILEEKVHVLSGLRNSNFSKVSETFGDLEKDLTKAGSEAPEQGHSKKLLPGSSVDRPLTVEVVPQSNTIASVESVLGSMGAAGLVVVFTIFVLMGQEDLRNRFIHLSSGGRLHVMTQALD